MFSFTSLLKPEYYNELEQLLFFNPGQKKMHSSIVSSVEFFGLPSIYHENQALRIRVEKLSEVQTLFAMSEKKLVGALVYTRLSAESLTVIHIAVDNNYSSDGEFADLFLAIRLLALLRKNASRITGINSIRIIYGENRIMNYKV